MDTAAIANQLKTELINADEAARIMDSATFKKAVSDIESALLLALHKSAFVDDKLREKVAQRYSALQDILQALRTTIETGQLARHQLDLEEQQKTLRQKFGAAVSQFR